MHTIQGSEEGLGRSLGRGGASPSRVPVHPSSSRRLEVGLKAAMRAVGMKGAQRGAGTGLPWGTGETRGPRQVSGGLEGRKKRRLQGQG